MPLRGTLSCAFGAALLQGPAQLEGETTLLGWCAADEKNRCAFARTISSKSASIPGRSSLIPAFKFRGSEDSAFPVSSFRAKSRNLSCTPDITTGVLDGRLNTSRFSSSNIQHFPVCKGDPSAALGMTVRGSSLSVSLGISQSSLNPAFKFRGGRRIALFPSH